MKAIDLDLMSKIGFHNSVERIKVSGNKITVKYWEMSYALGGIGFKLDYVYKNGKMVQKTTKAKVTTVQRKKYWTANRSMKVLKSPGRKSGWVKGLTKSTRPGPMFKEVMYAG